MGRDPGWPVKTRHVPHAQAEAATNMMGRSYCRPGRSKFEMMSRDPARPNTCPNSPGGAQARPIRSSQVLPWLGPDRTVLFTLTLQVDIHIMLYASNYAMAITIKFKPSCFHSKVAHCCVQPVYSSVSSLFVQDRVYFVRIPHTHIAAAGRWPEAWGIQRWQQQQQQQR